MFSCLSNPSFFPLRLASIRDLVSGKQLMMVLLKLFGFCVKVKANRQQLIQPDMNAISIMLGALNLVRQAWISKDSLCHIRTQTFGFNSSHMSYRMFCAV